MKEAYIDPGLNDGLTEATESRIREHIKPFKVGVYEGIIHPLLESGRESKKIARVVCAWCGKVLNSSIKTSTGLDSHGICEDCRDRYFSQGRE